ncbi:MAG: PD40 domain-containing protein [Acidobacteria bacterium]|nr:PD40 domain-containing protein [Acidobacteriota bacterium]MBI3423509.1 PD40 domain-containing protein [Acidobacteriota bacterium]
MNAERWAQIDQLLDEALARAPAERAAWLAQVCGNDAELRAEVASLLVAHEQANANFLQAPALEIAAKKLAQDNARILVGKTLGKYHVLSVLGVGGMGEVYLAHDPQLNRKLALKLLPPQFTEDAARVKRFEREAKAASALNHPNIITVYEIGQSAGEHFMAIEYVDGQTLREKLRQGQKAVKSPLKEALEIAIQIAAALSAAHAAGIVHRDIKPENVMVRRDGYVKVLDFGLAKLTEQAGQDYTTRGGTGNLGRTQPGVILGTVSYMSPEQALGLEVDQRSDIFTFGVLLYELVAGVLPFKGDSTASILDAIVHHPPFPITQVVSATPAEFERIVQRALEKDPELRYQTAADLRADLKLLLRDLNSAELALPPTRLSGKPRARKVALLSAAGVAVLLLMTLLAWRFFLAAQRPVATDWSKAKYQRLTEMTSREGNATISPDGQVVVFGRLLNGQWDLFWQRIGGSNPRNLTDHPANDGDPTFSPNGEQLAFWSARDGGGIYVMGATGENPVRLVDGGRDPSWSPDGQEIVYSTIYANVLSRFSLGGELWVVNLASRQKRRLEAGADAVQPSWSPHNQRIAFWGIRDGSKREIWTIPANGGTPVAVTHDDFDDANPVWSPDGRWLYFTSNRNGRWGIWRLPIEEATGQTQGQPEVVPTFADNSLEFSIAANGQRMVYTASRKANRIFRIGFDAASGTVHGEPIQVTQSERYIVTPDVSPNGEQLAYYSFGDPQFDLFIVNKDGTGQRQITNDTAKDRYPRWSPDGKRLAFFTDRSGKYEAWTIRLESGEPQQLTFSQPQQPGYVAPVWAPDGKQMAISIRGAGGYLMDLTRPWDAQQLVKLPAPAPNHWFLPFDWSADQQKLAGITGAAKTEDPGIVVYDLAAQRYQRLNQEGSVAHWLHDSRRLVYGANHKLYLADSRTGAIRELFALPNLDLDDPVASADSKWLYYCAYSIDDDVYLITLNE